MLGREVTIVVAAAFVVGCDRQPLDAGADGTGKDGEPTTHAEPAPDSTTSTTSTNSTTSTTSTTGTPSTSTTGTPSTSTTGTTTTIPATPGDIDPPVPCGTPVDTVIVADCAAGGFAAMLDGVGYASIQLALDDARSGDTVYVCPGTWGGNLTVDRHRTLAAADPTPRATVIDGQSTTWLIDATDTTIRGLTLVLGRRQDGGGAVQVTGDVLLDCIVATDNLGGPISSYGGAVTASTGVLTVRASAFARNEASYAGGAVEGDVVIVEDSIFVDNRSGHEGGALSTNGPATILRSTFSDNFAGYSGGAVGLSDDFFVEDSTFDGNEAGHSGGALDMNRWTLDPAEVTDSVFIGNTAPTGAGGIALGPFNNASIVVVGGSFEGNVGGSGGAISADGVLIFGGDITLDGTSFYDNVATGVGGGAVSVENGEVDTVANDVVMLRNEGSAGAIALPWDATFACTNCDMGAGVDDNQPVDATKDGVQRSNLGLDFSL